MLAKSETINQAIDSLQREIRDHIEGTDRDLSLELARNGLKRTDDWLVNAKKRLGTLMSLRRVE